MSGLQPTHRLDVRKRMSSVPSGVPHCWGEIEPFCFQVVSPANPFGWQCPSKWLSSVGGDGYLVPTIVVGHAGERMNYGVEANQVAPYRHRAGQRHLVPLVAGDCRDQLIDISANELNGVRHGRDEV